MSVNDKTMIVSSKDDQSVASMILEDVYNSLKEKGYNPISQMAGYLLSGDPTYIRVITTLAAIFAVWNGMN